MFNIDSILHYVFFSGIESHKHQNYLDKFMEARRIERENIGVMGVAAIWGKSPIRER